MKDLFEPGRLLLDDKLAFYFRDKFLVMVTRKITLIASSMHLPEYLSETRAFAELLNVGLQMITSYFGHSMLWVCLQGYICSGNDREIDVQRYISLC